VERELAELAIEKQLRDVAWLVHSSVSNYGFRTVFRMPRPS
jgi:hypothetical protein